MIEDFLNKELVMKMSSPTRKKCKLFFKIDFLHDKKWLEM